MLQVQLDSMHQRATATEAKLLDQIGMLQQQLDKERSARWAGRHIHNAARQAQWWHRAGSGSGQSAHNPASSAHGYHARLNLQRSGLDRPGKCMFRAQELLGECCHGMLWRCRCAAEASNTVTVAKAGAEHAALEKELAALKQEVRQGCMIHGCALSTWTACWGPCCSIMGSSPQTQAGVSCPASAMGFASAFAQPLYHVKQA